MVVDTHLYRTHNQTLIVGSIYSLEPPQLDGSYIYSQSVFRGKIKEKQHTRKFSFL